MAGYDPEKDKTLMEWKCEETGLRLSIHQYDGGEAKLQIGPRVLKKKDGTDRAPSQGRTSHHRGRAVVIRHHRRG